MKFELYCRHNWKVLEGFKPRSDLMLLLFSKDHSRCQVKDGIQGARNRHERVTSWEGTVSPGEWWWWLRPDVTGEIGKTK